MKIILHPYSPLWKKNFESEKLRLEKVLPPGSVVEHIGSTSVEGLGAKPIVDIMIGVLDFAAVASIVPLIVALGYTYVSEFESTMPERRFFTKDENGIRTVHIHMAELNSYFWKRHLLFRDHLRNNPHDRDEYFALKQELSQREWNNGGEYAAAKTDFIQKIERNVV